LGGGGGRVQFYTQFSPPLVYIYSPTLKRLFLIRKILLFVQNQDFFNPNFLGGPKTF